MSNSNQWNLAELEEEAIKRRMKSDIANEKEIKRIYRDAIDDIKREVAMIYAEYEFNGIGEAYSSGAIAEMETYINDCLEELYNDLERFMNNKLKESSKESDVFLSAIGLVGGYYADRTISKEWFKDNAKHVSKNVMRDVISNIALGKSPKQTIKAVGKTLKSGASSAVRELRTEQGNAHIERQKKEYENANVEYYQIIREPSACDHCKTLGGTSVTIGDAPKFKVSELTPGVNAPLFHPNCRCSTVPVIDNE